MVTGGLLAAYNARMISRGYSRCRSFAALTKSAMDAPRPAWLQSIVNDTSLPKKIYAWTWANISSASSAENFSSEDSAHRVHILGIGNMGRLYASCLARLQKPPPITLVVHRKELLTQWQQGPGIQITRAGVITSNKNFDVEWWTEERPEQGPIREISGGHPIRNLLITTKASTALPEVDRLRGYLDDTSTVAFAQNGMSKMWPPYGQVYVSQRYPDGKAPSFLSCITTHGVISLGPYKSLHASPADAVVGPVLPNPQVSDTSQYLMQYIAAAPQLDSRIVSKAELWTLQLEKLVVNSTINPLTAVLRCKNGVLFADLQGPVARVIDRLLHEASQVLQSLVDHPSVETILASPKAGDAADFRDARSELTHRFSHLQLKSMLYRVGALVAENTSSMLQDINAGKELEIKDFNGWIVDMAAYLGHGKDVPCHQGLVDLVEQRTVLTADELERQLLSL